MKAVDYSDQHLEMVGTNNRDGPMGSRGRSQRLIDVVKRKERRDVSFIPVKQEWQRTGFACAVQTLVCERPGREAISSVRGTISSSTGVGQLESAELPCGGRLVIVGGSTV